MPASSQPVIISMVFWLPVPMAVPSAPERTVPSHPQGANKSLGAAIKPCIPEESI